jgi:hypothetical protein
MFNVSLVFSSATLAIAGATFETLTGRKAVVTRQADDIARLSSDLEIEKLRNRNLVAKAEGLTADLVAERQAKRQIRSQLHSARTSLRQARKANEQLRHAVRSTAGRVSRRAVKTAGREVAAMPGEAIPGWGTVVIVGMTALEIKDLCDTISDMTELQKMCDPELKASSDQVIVCSQDLPTSAELWDTASSAPGKAWAVAKEKLPNFDELQFEFPDVDWPELGDRLAAKLSVTSEKISNASGKIATSVSSGAKRLAVATSDKTRQRWSQFQKWLAE